LSNPSERRIHPRHNTAFDIHATPQDGSVVARMVAENLSLGGLYCTSTSDMAEMTQVAVRLMLPKGNDDSSMIPLDLDAVVVRREPLSPSTSGEARFKLALFFTGVNDEARNRLISFLS
jgi:hypothetical protein